MILAIRKASHLAKLAPFGFAVGFARRRQAAGAPA